MAQKYDTSDAIRHYNSTTGTIPEGTPVAVGTSFVGVAQRPIPPLTTGTLALVGVHTLPKPTGAGTAITRGAKLSLFNGQMVTGATGVATGWAEEDAATTDNTVSVLIWPGC